MLLWEFFISFVQDTSALWFCFILLVWWAMKFSAKCFALFHFSCCVAILRSKNVLGLHCCFWELFLFVAVELLILFAAKKFMLTKWDENKSRQILFYFLIIILMLRTWDEIKIGLKLFYFFYFFGSNCKHCQCVWHLYLSQWVHTT